MGGLLFVHQAYDDINWIEDATTVYTYDGNGNVSEVVGGTGYSDWLDMDFAGRTLAQFRYDAFGHTLFNANGDLGEDGRFVVGSVGEFIARVPFTFSTKWEETTSYLKYHWYNPATEQWETTGNPRCRTLQYYGYRYLIVDTGRWLGRDPLAESGGLQLFTFTANDSISYVDLLGRQPRRYLNPNSGWGESQYIWKDDETGRETDYDPDGPPANHSSPKSLINDGDDALEHWRSGAGGTVPAGSALLQKIKEFAAGSVTFSVPDYPVEVTVTGPLGGLRTVTFSASRFLNFEDEYIFNGDWYNPVHWVTDFGPAIVAGPGVPFKITGTISQNLSRSFTICCWFN